MSSLKYSRIKELNHFYQNAIANFEKKNFLKMFFNLVHSFKNLGIKLSRLQTLFPQNINDMVAMERPDWQAVMNYVTAIYKHFEKL